MKRKITIFFFIFITGIICNTYISSAEVKKSEKNLRIHNLPIKSSNKKKLLVQQELKPYPLSSIEVAAKSVDSARNPFSTINKINSEVYVNPRKHFILNGLVQSGNQLNAILTSLNGVNFYKEGDYINKEFKIKKINLEQEAIVISNGEKEFKLALN